MLAPLMWSDNETAIDLLGFQHLVSGVTSIVREDALLPATIGVFGDWGSGKSSLLKMIEKDLQGEDGTLVLPFNGWLFEGYEDARAALMGSILDAIRDRENLPAQAQKLLKELLGRVNWMRVAGTVAKHGAALLAAGPVGLAMTTSVDMAGLARTGLRKVAQADLDLAGDYLSADSAMEARRAIKAFRDDFRELLEASHVRRLVVVIDDLDRCLPDSIIETLEAIKLFLYVPGTAFVVGADERLVKYAVRCRFPELLQESAEISAEYLEKIVQYPVRIPPLDASEVETYVNLLFAKRAQLRTGEFEAARQAVVGSEGAPVMGVRFNIGVATELLCSVPEDLKESLALAERVAPVLAAGLKGNPRQCKRFLNTLSMRLEMAKSRSLPLEQTILAKLMVLEYLKPEWFRRLAELQAGEEGRPLVLVNLETRARSSERAAATGSAKKRLVVLSKERKEHDGSEVEGRKRTGKSESGAAVPPELEPWLKDQWMREWLGSEPVLASVDLRPYFYFARDNIGPLGSSVRRITPEAQRVLSDLLHESEAQRKIAVRDAEGMSEADAAGIFEALATRASRENATGLEVTLDLAFEWVEARPELVSQLLTLLERIPVSQIPLSATAKLVRLVRGTDFESVGRGWLERLVKSTAKPALARSAEGSLRRLEGSG